MAFATETGPAIREALEAFAFQWSQAPHATMRRLIAFDFFDLVASAFGLQRRRDQMLAWLRLPAISAALQCRCD
jgi:hypothetical protein